MYEKGSSQPSVGRDVTSKVDRKQRDADVAFRAITSKSKIITVDEEFARGAGLLHSSVKRLRPNFSFGDAFTLHTAKNLSAKVLTGDSDFEGMKEAEMLH